MANTKYQNILQNFLNGLIGYITYFKKIEGTVLGVRNLIKIKRERLQTIETSGVYACIGSGCSLSGYPDTLFAASLAFSTEQTGNS
jgi:hypothetical protein